MLLWVGTIPCHPNDSILHCSRSSRIWQPFFHAFVVQDRAHGVSELRVCDCRNLLNEMDIAIDQQHAVPLKKIVSRSTLRCSDHPDVLLAFSLQHVLLWRSQMFSQKTWIRPPTDCQQVALARHQLCSRRRHRSSNSSNYTLAIWWVVQKTQTHCQLSCNSLYSVERK